MYCLTNENWVGFIVFIEGVVQKIGYIIDFIIKYVNIF